MGLEFRLMTANLLHEWCDAAALARSLRDLDPDVVITQELGPESAAILAETYPHHLLKPARDFTGRGIATRLEVEFDPEIEMPGRDGTAARLITDEGDIHLVGVHLINPIVFPWWTSVRTRSRQLEGLFTWLEQTEGPVIVAGDCNASPAWPAYKRLSATLPDLVAEWAETEGARPERTWGWRPGWPRMLRIDHVFGRGVRVRQTRVVPIEGSDHHAVVVDLTVGT
jgi:endonuclease/exonuclease/phosphatase (EEP) superfamily protein YafD